MHTHFGSATFAAAVFLPIVIIGTLWRVGWMHAYAFGIKRGSRAIQGFARAALSQY